MLKITYSISDALLCYLLNGRILSEAFFISQMEGSLKERLEVNRCSAPLFEKKLRKSWLFYLDLEKDFDIA